MTIKGGEADSRKESTGWRNNFSLLSDSLSVVTSLPTVWSMLCAFSLSAIGQSATFIVNDSEWSWLVIAVSLIMTTLTISGIMRRISIHRNNSRKRKFAEEYIKRAEQFAKTITMLFGSISSTIYGAYISWLLNSQHFGLMPLVLGLSLGFLIGIALSITLNQCAYHIYAGLDYRYGVFPSAKMEPASTDCSS